jgi:Peptidase family M23
MPKHKVRFFPSFRSFPLRRFPEVLSTCFFLAFASNAVHGQECEHGVNLRLNTLAPSQGTLLLAEVSSVAKLSEVKGEWDSRAIPFWQSDIDGKVWRALLGADIEKPAGDYNFKVAAEAPAGDPVSCTASISVKEGRFPTENLHVENKFVEPDPQQLARIEEEGKRLREIFDRVTPERFWKGAFRLPLKGVTTGGNFGRRRVLNGEPRAPHSGVDFPSPAGTPVHAAQHARVALAESLYLPGNTVILDHGLGIYTLYFHLSEISVKAGDLVNAGTVIGKVGATGRVTGPHARVNALQIVKLLRQ